MAHHETMDRLTSVLHDVAGVDPSRVTTETALAKDLGLDSRAMMEMSVTIEQDFAVIILDDATSNFQTVGDVVRYLESSSAFSDH